MRDYWLNSISMLLFFAGIGVSSDVVAMASGGRPDGMFYWVGCVVMLALAVLVSIPFRQALSKLPEGTVDPIPGKKEAQWKMIADALWFGVLCLASASWLYTASVQPVDVRYRFCLAVIAVLLPILRGIIFSQYLRGWRLAVAQEGEGATGGEAGGRNRRLGATSL